MFPKVQNSINGYCMTSKSLCTILYGQFKGAGSRQLSIIIELPAHPQMKFFLAQILSRSLGEKSFFSMAAR